MSLEYHIMIALFVVAIIWIYWRIVLIIFLVILSLFLYPMAHIAGFLWGMSSSLWKFVRRN